MLAIIPARGGSKRLPRKNLLPLAGKPLIAYSIEQALAARTIDRVIVSTEDDEIALAALQAGAEVPFRRPANLATDTIGARAACLDTIDQLAELEPAPRAAFAHIQPTSPFLRACDIDAAVEKFETEQFSAVIAVTPAAMHLEGVFELDAEGHARSALEATYGIQPVIGTSQSHGPRYQITGAVCVLSVAQLRKDLNYFFSDPAVGAIVTPPEFALDVDTAFDLQLAQFILESGALKQERNRG